ncbi:hypothetical protein KL864_34055 [Mycolicibacterium goodii]|uniref:hypothetical protein n=1 Tax=Mycolicibacterium goodii TaxID=134601 RepID=UPI001BDCA9D7|nr:hypothetical protein [Mycolicibacterium goodii]MBU8820891.1 hypothetical protein [Mycolicibacterium goodii]
MNRLLSALNPISLALRLGRGAAAKVFTVLRWKLILATAVAAAAALVALAGVYTITAPLGTARQLAAHLRGGAPNMPAHRYDCLPTSAAVTGGRYSPDAQATISQIPPNATIASASAYLLYRWSHLQENWQPSWREWEIYLHEHLISPTASDIEIAQTVDPATDYTPYLVPARSTVVDLASGGPVVASRKQLQTLAEQVYNECRRKDEDPRSS